MKLTLTHLEEALGHEKHLGFGYATRDSLASPRTLGTLAKLDCAVVDVANELKLNFEELFHWTNSKYGRWLVDDVYGNDSPPTKATVRRNLNKKAVDVAMDGAICLPEEVQS